MAGWLGAAGLLAATAVASGIAIGLLAPSVGALYGMGDLGPVVDVGLPAARVAALAAAAVAVGQLLVAAVYRPGDPHGVVSGDGYRALHAARFAAATQTVAALVAALLTVAENTGVPPATLLSNPGVFVAAAAVLAPAAGWLLTAAVALVVAASAAVALSWRSAVGLLVLALVSIAPMTLTTSTDADRSHDIIGDAMTLHALGAVLWLGSTVAVALHLGRGGAHPDVVLRRHDRIATGCLLVVGASGLATVWVQLTPADDVLGSGYGQLVVASTVLLAGAAATGHRLRGRARRGGPGRALGLVAVEAALLAAAAGAGTGLIRVLPPAEQDYTTTRLVYLIGYELPAHLNAADLATFWRWDVVFGTLAVVAAGAYLHGLRRLRRAGRRWPVACTVSWMAGCAVLLVATSSGLGAYAPAVFSVHMVRHMLLATLVPVLLVLGHGVTLVLDAARPPLRARLLSLLDSPAVRLLRHPAVAWAAVAVTLFGLYATGLYADVLQEHWAHLSMDLAFLGTGLALYWPVLGHDLPGRGLPPIGRIVMVFAVMGLHAAFAAWLLSRSAPVAGAFYSSLQLPYLPDLLADQRRGAVLAWALGELPTLIAVVALFRRWSRTEHDAPATPDWTRPHTDIDSNDQYPQHSVTSSQTSI